MTHLLPLLLLLTLATSTAVLLVALLRRPLARLFDDRAAYLAWLCVPAAMLAALLPSPQAALPAAALELAPEMPAPAARATALATQWAGGGAAGEPWGDIALAVWLAGAAAMALGLAVQQRRFVGRLQPAPGASHWLLPAGTSACVVGVWRPRLALPADFNERFSGEERALILAHEAVHLARRDNVWNLLAAACCSMQWFNPLAWWAWRRMRADQELACDAVALVDRQPGAALSCYAQALVRSHQQAAQALLPTLASPWRPRAGLVERVERLPAHARRRGAARRDRLWIAGLIVGTAGAVSATTARPTVPALEAGQGHPLPSDLGPVDAPTTLRWRLQAREDGRSVSNQVQSLVLMHGRSPAGRTARYVEHDARGPRWCFETAGQRFQDGSWRITGRLLDARCEALLAEPRVIATDGSAQTFQGRLADGRRLDIDISARRFALPAGSFWMDAGVDHNLPAAAPSGQRLVGTMGQRLRMATGRRPAAAGETLAVEFTTTADGDDRARIQARLSLGQPARLLAEPQVVTRWGEPAQLRWEDPATGQRVALRVTPHRAAPQRL